MFLLKIVDPGGKSQEIQLDKDPLTIGRGSDCDVVLRSRSVFRHHLKAWTDGDSAFVEDLTEGQGTLVDGARVESDIIQLDPEMVLEAGVFQISLAGLDELDTTVGSTSTEPNIPEVTAKTATPTPEAQEIKRPRLVGTRGSLKGREFDLPDGETEIGRAETNHIMLDYQSISRLHAKILVHGDQASFQDMRSSNGTYLNKKKTPKGRLRHGDTIRFGAIEFVYALGAFDVAKYHAKKKRKVMIVSLTATLAAILAVVVVFLGLLQPPKPKPVKDNSGLQPKIPSVPPEIRADKHMKEAESLYAQQKWEQAKKANDQALEIHPLCKPCRNLDARIAEEIKNAEHFNKGVVEFDLKHWAEARHSFKAISSDSHYFRLARAKLSTAEDKLSKYYKLTFKDADRDKDFVKAHTIAVEYMRLNPCDEPVYEAWIKRFEKQLRRKRKDFTPYRYDCDSVKQVGPLEPKELIRKIYPEKEIGDAVFAYYEGKIDKAISDLKDLGTSTNRPVRVKAKDLFSKLLRLKDKHMEGGAQLMRGNDGGRKILMEAMRLDAEIIPSGITSRYRTDMAVQVASRLYKKGFVNFRKNDYFKAFALWDECLQLHPGDHNCEGGMKKLEGVAKDVLGMAERQAARGQKRKALAILKDMQRIVRPGTTRYKEAQYLIDKLNK